MLYQSDYQLLKINPKLKDITQEIFSKNSLLSYINTTFIKYDIDNILLHLSYKVLNYIYKNIPIQKFDILLEEHDYYKFNELVLDIIISYNQMIREIYKLLISE